MYIHSTPQALALFPSTPTLLLELQHNVIKMIKAKRPLMESKITPTFSPFDGGDAPTKHENIDLNDTLKKIEIGKHNSKGTTVIQRHPTETQKFKIYSMLPFLYLFIFLASFLLSS